LYIRLTLACCHLPWLKSLRKGRQTETSSSSTSGPVIVCVSCFNDIAYLRLAEGTGTDELWQASRSGRYYSQTCDPADGQKGGNASLIESKVKSHGLQFHPVNWQCVSLTLQEHFVGLWWFIQTKGNTVNLFVLSSACFFNILKGRERKKKNTKTNSTELKKYGVFFN